MTVRALDLVPGLLGTPRAACRGRPVAWWYPEHGSNSLELGRARRLCAGWPVAEQFGEAGRRKQYEDNEHKQDGPRGAQPVYSTRPGQPIIRGHTGSPGAYTPS
jgi:hypothetical protein